MKPFFVTIPHSGEDIPEECRWLKPLPETILMQDVDRYVDRLYEPTLSKLGVPLIKTNWHRYAVDLNRIPEDIDQSSVLGAKNLAGQFSRGFHWVMTTKREPLMNEPMSPEMHQKLIELIYEPFHISIQNHCRIIKAKHPEIFHLDLHSMPSLGTSEHRDPGETRAEIVISDSSAKSSRADFVDLVLTSYLRAGLQVRYNWPYYGGRLTEQYGQPQKGHHCVQVEINRSLYMDEETKKWLPEKAALLMNKLEKALTLVESGIKKLN